jgi:hypothetical protein
VADVIDRRDLGEPPGEAAWVEARLCRARDLDDPEVTRRDVRQDD